MRKLLESPMTEFLAITLIILLAAISPGPDFVMVVKNSLLHGKIRCFAAIFSFLAFANLPTHGMEPLPDESAVSILSQCPINALIQAIINKNPDEVEKCLALGADPFISQKDGLNALDFANFSKDEKIKKIIAFAVARKVLELLENKKITFVQDIDNPTNDQGDTALISAMYWIEENRVFELLSQGADPSVKRKDGLSAIDYAKNLIYIGDPYKSQRQLIIYRDTIAPVVILYDFDYLYSLQEMARKQASVLPQINSIISNACIINFYIFLSVTRPESMFLDPYLLAKHLRPIFSALKNNTRIKKVSLRVDLISGQGAEPIAEFLKANRTLIDFSISSFSRPEQDGSFQNIVEAIKNNYTLQNFAYKELGCFGTSALTPAQLETIDKHVKWYPRLWIITSVFLPIGFDTSDFLSLPTDVKRGILKILFSLYKNFLQANLPTDQ